MTQENEGRAREARRFGDIDHGKRSGPKKYPPHKPSRKALRAARLADAPLDRPKDRAKAARAIVAQLAIRWTAWRRTGP